MAVETAAPERAQSPVVYQGQPLPLTAAAYTRFEKAKIELILASVVPPGTPLPMAYRFIELSAELGLNPLTGEIWLANMAGKDGGGGKLAIMVGRDGYLTVARRQDDFVDCNGMAVYSNDHFRPVYRGIEKGWDVEHEPAHPRDRGEPLGAWALLARRGAPARYFFAPLAQFKRSGGAWKYEDGMIVKCAMSYVLRTTYGVSGPVPYDEVSVGFNAAGSVDGSASEERAEARSPMEMLPDELRELVARASSLDPKSWRVNEVLARIDPDDATTVRRVRLELEEWLRANTPVEAEVVDAAVAVDVPAVDVPDGVGGEKSGEQVVHPTFTYEQIAGALQEKWDAEPEWREQVGPLLERLSSLDAARDDATDQQHTDIISEMDSIENELLDLGVPIDWRPSSGDTLPGL
jgi:hypothetical protein